MSASTEVINLPSPIDEVWLEQFTETYGKERCIGKVCVEDWLEQPLPEEGSEYRETGSGYFELNDLMSSSGWEQTIVGKIHSAAYTNIPHYRDTGFANVLAITEANVQREDDEPFPLAGGGLVLVRLDRLIKPLVVECLN